jgi:hypothetical protein
MTAGEFMAAIRSRRALFRCGAVVTAPPPSTVGVGFVTVDYDLQREVNIIFTAVASNRSTLMNGRFQYRQTLPRSTSGQDEQPLRECTGNIIRRSKDRDFKHTFAQRIRIFNDPRNNNQDVSAIVQ